MAHWNGKFSIGTFLVLKDSKTNSFYPKCIQIQEKDSFNFYKVKVYRKDFSPYNDSKTSFFVSDLKLFSFSDIESQYKIALQKTLQEL